MAEELDGEIKQLNDLLKNAPYKNNPELREKIQGLINNAEPNTDIWKGHVKDTVVDFETFEFLYTFFLEVYADK